MKQLLLSLLFTSALFNAQVVSFPWVETFETNSPTVSSWTKIYESGTKEWANVQTAYAGYSTGAYAGSYMAEFDITSFGGDTTKYVSPVLNLTGVSNPTLDFYYRNRDWGGDQNLLKVYYRTSSSSAWNLIATYNSSQSPWITSGVLALPSPSSTYQIALEGVAMYGYSIDVDDVRVTSVALSTSETSGNKNLFKVYPNPTSDYVHITSKVKISEISLFDMNGKKVKSLNAEKSEANISVRDLPSGVYVVRVEGVDGSISSQKLIKQ